MRSPEARNSPQKLFYPVCLLAAALFAGSCATGDGPGFSATRQVQFERDVKPLLEFRCLQCHNSRISHGSLNLESRELAFRPRPGGPVIVPGDPDASLVNTVVRISGTLNAMPPTRHRLTEKEVKTIRRWIEAGAEWPDGEAGRLRAPAEEYPYPPVDHPALRNTGGLRS